MRSWRGTTNSTSWPLLNRFTQEEATPKITRARLHQQHASAIPYDGASVLEFQAVRQGLAAFSAVHRRLKLLILAA
jgi:hypothetical protein